MNWIKKILLLIPFFSRMKEKSLVRALEETVSIAKRLEAELSGKLANADRIYTTIKTFYNQDAAFWPWAKELIVTDQYKYLLFSLRENTIREMVGCTDTQKLIEYNGRLNMIQIFDRYLSTGIKEYEEKLLRDQQNTQGPAATK